MACWNELPTEIRLKILQMLADDARSNRECAKRSLASYATVCAQWQMVFEQMNFRQLRLDDSDIALFKIIAGRRTNHIKRIILSVRMLNSFYPFTLHASSHLEKEIQSSRVCETLSELFAVLRSWETKYRLSCDGLTLELNTCTLMCSERCSAPRDHFATSMVHTFDTPVSVYHSPAQHRPSCQLSQTSLRSFASRLVRPAYLHYRGRIPKVDCITALVLRREAGYGLDLATIADILSSLPKLEDFQIGLADDRFVMDTHPIFQQYSSVFGSSLPVGLRRLRITDSFGDRFDSLMDISLRDNTDYIRHVCEVVAPIFAKASLPLEELCIYSFVDAIDFFDAIQDDWVWNDLKRVTLTSRILAPPSDPTSVSDLLCQAANAVRKMPKLKSMLLRGTTGGNSAWLRGVGVPDIFMFRYVVAQDGPKLMWICKWGLELEPRVAATWKEVAFEHTQRELKISR